MQMPNSPDAEFTRCQVYQVPSLPDAEFTILGAEFTRCRVYQVPGSPAFQIEHLFLFQSSLENSKIERRGIVTAWITDTCLWSAVCGHDCNLPKIFFYTISPIIFIHYFYTLKSIVRHLCFDNKRYSFDGINLLSDCIKLLQRAPQIPT